MNIPLALLLVLLPTAVLAETATDQTGAQPVPAQAGATAQTCVWSGHTFSIGAYFCATRSVAIRCAEPGTTDDADIKHPFASWVYARSADCDRNRAMTP